MRKIIALVIAVVLMASLLSVAGFAAQDTTPPVITKIEGESATITPGVEFHFKVYATDNDGFKEGFIGHIYFKRVKESEKENDRVYPLSITNDPGADYFDASDIIEDDNIDSGIYVIDYIELSDKNGNKTRLDSNNDPQHVIPDIRLNIKTAWNDVISPEIQKVEAKSQVLRPGDQFQVVVYATDNGKFAGKSDYSSRVALVHEEDQNDTKEDQLKQAYLEDQGDGRLIASFAVGDDWKRGEYTIREVSLVDTSYNTTSIQNYWGDSLELSNYVFTVIDKNAPSPPPRRPFEDVPTDTWYTGAVTWVTSAGWMSGTGNYKFSPDATVTRGMIAQILYAAEGKPEVSGTSKFTDVKAGKWYANAVNWAAGKGLVSGYGNGQFKPDAPITREQMVAILYKYAEMKGYDLSVGADLSKFPDQGKISKWAVTSVKWGVAHGIISGTDKGIEPQGNATRAQVAVILRGFDRLRP